MVSHSGHVKNGKPEGLCTHYNEFPANLYTSFDHSDFNHLGENWVKFSGDYKQGVRNGKGTLYLTNGERVDGSWSNGKLHGEAVVFKANGRAVQGRWEGNCRKSMSYEGHLKGGKREGDGVEFGKGGLVLYSGDWVTG